MPIIVTTIITVTIISTRIIPAAIVRIINAVLLGNYAPRCREGLARMLFVFFTRSERQPQRRDALTYLLVQQCYARLLRPTGVWGSVGSRTVPTFV